MTSDFNIVEYLHIFGVFTNLYTRVICLTQKLSIRATEDIN